MARPRQTAKVLSLSPARLQDPPGGVLIGRVMGYEEGSLTVDVPRHGIARARLAIRLAEAKAHEAAATRAEAVLVLQDGDPARPIVLGLIEQGFADAATEARVDGRRVEIEGKDEVVLRCGEATITLRANGKVVIRGAYVETRSSGTNRIKGGSVQIN